MEINITKPQSERETMLKELQSYKFAAYDLGLFLDTHPTDKRALVMFKELSQKAKELGDEFQKQYGPLKMSASQNDDAWDWISNPWPWQEQ